MMPTGGVSAGNVAEWFYTGVVAVGAGSELCPPQLAKDGKFDEISKRAAEFVEVVKAARNEITISRSICMNKENYPVVTKSVPTFYFIGVTTGKSSIMKVFPLWMKVWAGKK